MSRYNIYPECHESGIAWLNKLPTHWELDRFKNIFKIQKRIAGTLGHDVLSITQKGVKIKDTESGDGQLSMDYSKYQIVKKDDFAMNHMDLLTGYVDISKFDGVTSPDYRVFTINEQKHHPRYFLYLLQLCYIAKIFYPLGQGAAQIGRWRLPTEAFNEFVTPVPTYREQQLITTFLDHETAKIDALIEKQQRLIELLKEKRQAVISHAVTKGLNPNAPMKDSGVEWLGEVPAHWGMTKFHYEIDLLEGPGILANDFHDEGVPLLRIQNVKDEFVSRDYKTYLSPSKVRAKWDHFRVAQGDLIISCSATTGLVSEVGEDTVGAVPYTGLIRLRPQVKASITKEFIRCLVQSDLFFEQIKLLQSGSTIQHFGPYHLQQMHITLPALTEQNKIAKAVKEKTARLDKLISIADQQIELMQERRTALISAAVTGKIDVRDWPAAA